MSGKLLDPSHGRPSITVDVSGGEVVLQFDRECQWVGLKPDNAVELAYAIYEKARRAGARNIGGDSGLILLPKH